MPFGSYLQSLPADDALLACGLLLPITISLCFAGLIAAFVTLFAPMKGY